MYSNPYQYKGPLDPEKDKLVCIPRDQEVEAVINDINWGEYWAILGPRQIGKTTFLRQIQNKAPNDKPYLIYFDFSVSPLSSENVYKLIKKSIIETVPSEPLKADSNEGTSPEVDFINFLCNFKPQKDRRIMLLLDEVEKIPDFRQFLELWETIYHMRHQDNRLKRYILIVTGTVMLKELSEGKKSPFGIAKTLHLKDFPKHTSERLIKKPLEKLGIKVESEAINVFHNKLSGHPQMLQKACHMLVEKWFENKKTITETDIKSVIKSFHFEHACLDALRWEVTISHALRKLLTRILEDQKVPFKDYEEYSVAGTGAIVEGYVNYCAIRNEVYKEFLTELLKELPPLPEESEQKKAPVAFICCAKKDEEWWNKFSVAPQYRHEFLSLDSKVEFENTGTIYNEIEKNITNADLSLFILPYQEDVKLLDLLDRKEKEGNKIIRIRVPVEAEE